MAIATTAPRRTNAIRVMVVDDHALLRAAVRVAITDSSLEMVAEAATAEEALRIAPDVKPDVLLVDIDLPGMDGVRLVRELAPRLPETRIVMLTVSTSDHDVLAAMRYGAKGFLTKDLSPDALVRAVRSAFDGELAMPRRLAARLVDRLCEGPPHPGRSVDGEALATLSLRETEVLELLAAGLTDRQIGEALVISPRTVETHVGSVLHKLGARNRGAAAILFRDAS